MAKDQHQRRLGFKNGTALLTGSVIGGGIGLAAYGFPMVATAAFWVGAPLLATSVVVKAIEVLLPKGDLKEKVKPVTRKLFTAGVVTAFLPVVAMGTVGFMATKKLLDILHVPFAGIKKAATKMAPAPAEAADGQLTGRSLKSSFTAVRARATRFFKAAPAPKPEVTQAPQP